MKKTRKNFRILRTTILAVTFLMLMSHVILSAGQQISMVIGQQMTLDGRGVTRVVVGDPDIVSVKTTATQITLFAKTKGATNISLFDQSGNPSDILVTVLAQDPQKLRNDILELLNEIEGIDVRVIGDNVFIDGKVYKHTDMDRITRVAEGMGDQVKVLAYYDETYVPSKENIDIRVDFLELSKDVAAKYGISWSSAISSAGSFSASFDKSSGGPTTGSLEWGLLSNLQSVINLTATDGASKIWHTDHFTTTNGSEGKYFAGGTIHVKTATQDQAGITDINYGSQIKATPRLSKEKMLIDIEVEISSIDFSEALKTDGIPSLKKKTISTTVSMNLGESVVLAGVVDRVNDKNYEKVPALGDIPVLGYLFKSKQYRKGQSDGLIVLTPTVIQSNDPSHVRKMKEMQDLFND